MDNQTFNQMEVIDPGPTESGQAKWQLASRTVSLSGKRIGWISNRKLNAALILETLALRVQAMSGGGIVLAHEKRGPAVPMADGVSDRFARECDAVIVGVAD